MGKKVIFWFPLLQVVERDVFSSLSQLDSCSSEHPSIWLIMIAFQKVSIMCSVYINYTHIIQIYCCHNDILFIHNKYLCFPNAL